MCLGVFLASASEIPLYESPEISVQVVSDSEKGVGRLFTLHHIRYIGAHGGCSCGFPHVIAEQPVEWHEGFFESEDEDRSKDLTSVRGLFALIATQLEHSTEVQIYPVWNGDEEKASKGTIDLAFSELDPERFFFNEQFLHRIHK